MDRDKMISEKLRILSKMDNMFLDLAESESDGSSEELYMKHTIIFMAAIDYGINGLTKACRTPAVELVATFVHSLFNVYGAQISTPDIFNLSEKIVKVVSDAVAKTLIRELPQDGNLN